jgi:hypothetical protein
LEAGFAPFLEPFLALFLEPFLAFASGPGGGGINLMTTPQI